MFEIHSCIWEWSRSVMSPCINYMQYPWGYAVPVSHILSTGEDMQYPWVISSVPVSHILSTGEDMQYPWVISSVPVSHILTGTEDMTHGYWGYDSRVMHTLTGTEDMTHGYCWYDSRVMHILTGTAYSLYRVGVYALAVLRFGVGCQLSKKDVVKLHRAFSLCPSARFASVPWVASSCVAY